MGAGSRLEYRHLDLARLSNLGHGVGPHPTAVTPTPPGLVPTGPESVGGDALRPSLSREALPLVACIERRLKQLDWGSISGTSLPMVMR